MRWVLGDVHGMLVPLRALVEEIRKSDPSPSLLFVGDFVNRGPDSCGVVEFILSMDDVRCCRGNHDDAFDLVLNNHWLAGEPDAYDPLQACLWFCNHGLVQTLTSYGMDEAEVERHRYTRSPKLLDMVRSVVPTRHKDFFRRLPMVLDEADAMIAHAYWPPQEPNDPLTVRARLADASMRYRVIWERWQTPDVKRNKAWSRRGYFGHTPVVNYEPVMRNGGIYPVTGPGLVMLDTGCAVQFDGRLTAVCIETDTCLQVDRHGTPVV